MARRAAPAAPPERTDAGERRVPVQARSRKRYDAILDAAAEVFAEGGFEVATVEAIAERAATSIGSVYQFFPNKVALFDAVAERCLVRSREAFDRLFDAVPESTPWPVLIDAAVDAFAALHASDPAFRATVVNVAQYPLYQERDDALTRYMVGRVAEMIGARAPHVDARRAKLLALVLVQIIASMMFVAERSAPPLRAALREELKSVARRYLEPEVDAPPPRRKSLRRA
ncbi:MAG: TetR/AcrR family transcriptional regulator [Myxococcota bacterium]|nr:TetR/AcrR family transcriptional regulator [Myxococcota bacterium]